MERRRANNSIDLLDELDRKSIRKALKAWGRSQSLGEHPLTKLEIVETRRRAAGYVDDVVGWGQALRDVLQELIAKLKPEDAENPDYSDRRWRGYIIVTEQYLEERDPAYLADRLGISRSHYNHEQADTLDMLVDMLHEYAQSPSASDTFAALPLIPTLPGLLVGRDAVKASIHSVLHAGGRVSLCGMGGMGKTALAAAVAYERQKRGEVVLWLDIGPRDNWASVYTELGRIFDDPKMERLAPEKMPAQARGILTRRNFQLIVLDNVWDGAAARQFEREALPNDCALLITGRERVGVGRVYDLASLGSFESATLLRYHANFSERADVSNVVALLGGHPLSLEIAGKLASIHGFSPDELYARLAGLEDRAHNLALGDRTNENVWASLALTYEVLSADARIVFRAFGALWTPAATAELLASTVNLDLRAVQDALAGLVRRSLVMPEMSFGVRRYRVHDLNHDFARKLLVDAGTFEAIRLDALDASVAYAEHYARQSAEAYDHLDAERDNLLAAAEWGGKRERWDAVKQLAFSLWEESGFLRLRGYSREATSLLALSVNAARALGQQRDESRLLGCLGIAHRDLGQIDQAVDWHQRALDLACELGDLYTEKTCFRNLGSDYVAIGEMETSVRYYRRALVIARKLGDRHDEAYLLNRLGVVLRFEDLNTAVDYHNEALAIARECGNRRIEADILGALGLAHSALGDMDTAIDYYRQALSANREVGDLPKSGETMGNLGLAYIQIGRFDDGLDYLHHALDVARQVNDRQGEGRRLGILGYAYKCAGQPAEAIPYYRQALTIARETGDKRGIAVQLNGLGDSYSQTGRQDAAIVHLLRSRDILRQIGDVRNEGYVLGDLGSVCRRLGDLDRAEVFYEHALSWHQKSGYQRGVGEWLYALGNLAMVHADAAEDDERRIALVRQAITRYEESHAVWLEMKDPREEEAVAALVRARLAIKN